MTGFNFGCGSPTAWWSFFQKSIFLIKIHTRQYLNKMGEFLKLMELKYSMSRQYTDSKANIMNIPKEPELVQLFWSDKWLTTTILVKTLGTLSSWPPSPLNSVGCYKSNTFYISCTLYEHQLCFGGVGKNLVRAVFISVYRRLAANSIQKPSEKGKEAQNLLARIVAQHYQIRCTRSPAHKTLSLRATFSRTAHMVNSF